MDALFSYPQLILPNLVLAFIGTNLVHMYQTIVVGSNSYTTPFVCCELNNSTVKQQYFAVISQAEYRK